MKLTIKLIIIAAFLLGVLAVSCEMDEEGTHFSGITCTALKLKADDE